MNVTTAKQKSILVDADACPVAIREILIRAARRWSIRVTFLANHHIRLPASPYLASIQVEQGYDVADQEIVRRMNPGDLVISSDIPLADEVIQKSGAVLSPRGELFTKENIKSRLNIRDFMESMRSSGIQSGGPPPLGASEKQAFANHLDRWLAKNIGREQHKKGDD